MANEFVKEMRNELLIQVAKWAADNRFLVFAGEKYEASGGWGDFFGAFQTVQLALEALAKPIDKTLGLVTTKVTYIDDEFKWWQIVDLRTKEIILSSKSDGRRVRKCADCGAVIPPGQPLCNCNTSGDLG